MSAQRLRRLLGGTYSREGWEWSLTKGGHVKGKHASGAIVFTSASPSDHRAQKNLLSDIRRLEKPKAGA